MGLSVTVASVVIVLSVFLQAAEGDEYEYFQLVLQYQVNVCTSRRAMTTKPCRRTPNPVFSLHGLWPSNYSGVHLKCVGTPFNTGLISRGQRGRSLDYYWPDLYNPNTNIDFWRYEWGKHGVCSETIFSQVAYFDFTVDVAKQVINILQTNSIVATYQQLNNTIFNAIGAYPVFNCRDTPQKVWQLTEIVVCVNKQIPVFENCPKNASFLDTNCPRNFIF